LCTCESRSRPIFQNVHHIADRRGRDQISPAQPSTDLHRALPRPAGQVRESISGRRSALRRRTAAAADLQGILSPFQRYRPRPDRVALLRDAGLGPMQPFCLELRSHAMLHSDVARVARRFAQLRGRAQWGFGTCPSTYMLRVAAGMRNTVPSMSSVTMTWHPRRLVSASPKAMSSMSFSSSEGSGSLS